MSFGFGFGLPQWQALSAGFNPISLFAGGVNGAFYDPSDLTTLFTTSSGTNPVSMPGQGSAVSVGLMLDKSQGLVLGSELITPEANRDFSSDTGYWTKEAGVTISGGTANWSATANSDLYKLNVLTVGKWYRITWTISSYTSGNFRLSVGGTTGVFRTAAGTYTETYYAASNGTFAITGQSSATGSVDNISVRELPGNHAISINDSTARPELRARVNLLTYSEEFQNAAWTKDSCTITANATTAPNGTLTADKVVSAAATAQTGVGQSVTTTAAQFTQSWFAKQAEVRFVQLLWNGGASAEYANFDLQTGVVTQTNASVTPTISAAANGFYRITLTSTSASGTVTAYCWAIGSGTAGRAGTYPGNGTDGWFVWGADLRPANIGAAVPAYQRIADANTYDTAGFPLYLRFDGIDDGMYTPANLNLSATDKVGVFAGVRKLSDANAAVFTEFSALFGSNNGSFALYAPDVAAAAQYYFGLQGTTVGRYIATGFAAPITNVLSVGYNIGGATIAEEIVPRINGVLTQTNPSASNAGTGNFGTYPLYIGSRANSSLWFNGHLHGLIVVGSAVSAGNISATESWMANKTGLVLP